MLLWLTTPARAQESLPEAPGKKAVATVCSACHDLDTAIGMRHAKVEWKAIVDVMADRGARATDQEFAAIVEYLGKYFGVVNANTGTARELQEVLEISSDQADAIVRYRNVNGKFKDLETLKKVPGVDAKLIEERKDRIAFQESK